MRRVRRFLLLALGVFGALLALTSAGGLYLLGHLEAGVVKSRVQEAVDDALGVAVDYEALSVDLFGGRVRLDGLRLGAPAGFSEHDPTLLTLASLETELDLWGALTGGPLVVDRLALDGLTVTMVITPEGNSLTALVPPAEDAEEEPPAPLSHTLADLREALAAYRVDELALHELTLRVVVVDEARAETGEALLTPVSLTGRLTPEAAAERPWLVAELAPTGEGPARLEVTSSDEPGRREMALPFRVDARLIGRGVADLEARFALERHGLRQVRRDPARATLEAQVAFDPEAGETRIRIASLSLLGQALALDDLVATVRDDAPATLADLGGRARLAFPGPSPLALPGVDARDADLSLTIDGGNASANAFDGDATLTGELGALDLDLPEGGRLAVRQVTADLRAEGSAAALPSAPESAPPGRTPSAGVQAGVGRFSGVLTAASVELDDPVQETRLAGEGLRGEVTLADFALGGDGLFGLRGAATGRLSFERVDATTPGGQVEGASAGLAANADFDRGTLGGELPVDRLTLRSPRGAPVVDLRGTVLRAETDAPLGWSPGDPGGAEATVDGTVGQVAASGVVVSLPQVVVELAREPSSSAYRVRADLGLGRVRGIGVDLDGRRRLRLEGRGDLGGPTLRASMALDGASGPDLDVTLDARLVPAGAADDLGAAGPTPPAGARGSRVTGRSDLLVYELEGDLEGLGALLAGIVPDGIEVGVRSVAVDAQGRVSGVLRRGPRGRPPEVVGSALGDLRGMQEIRLVLTDLGGSLASAEPDAPPTSGKAPELSLRIVLDHEGVAGTDVVLDGQAGYVELDLPGTGRVKLRSLEPRISGRLSAAAGGDATVRLSAETRLGEGELPDLAPALPLRETRLRFDLDLGPRAVVVEDLVLDNPATSTRLELSATYESALEGRGEDVVPGRVALVVDGALDQEVAALQATGLVREAAGRLRVPFRVTSGDLVALRVEATPTAEAVTLVDASGGLAVRGFEGSVPVVEDVAVLSDRMEIGYGTPVNALSRTRYFDVHPFLGGEDFVSAEEVTVYGATLGPLAGNVRIAGTVFAVDRLQTGYRGGTVAGQLLVDLRRQDGRVSFRGNATGIRPGGPGLDGDAPEAAGGDDGDDGDDQVLDMNGAFVFVPETLALDGTVNVVRISRVHLREMLDLIDPFHESVSANRVRSLLGLGYPSYLRLRAQDGLLDVSVELGGLAGFVRVDDITAIPLAPLLEQYVGPTVDSLFPAPPGTAASEADAPEGGALEKDAPENDAPEDPAP